MGSDDFVDWKHQHFRPGTLLKARSWYEKEVIVLVGDCDSGCNTTGCGCCSDQYEPFEYAYLQELLPTSGKVNGA